MQYNLTMADADPKFGRKRRPAAMPLPDQVALVLQGGGALGSYQAGIYEALDAADIEIDRVAGISIGAVNAAIIAGNPPEKRVAQLRKFWDRSSAALPSFPIWHDDLSREILHLWSANVVAMVGVPGFFQPRLIPPIMAIPGTPEALSIYDSAPLAETLNELIDWDLLNDGPVRIAVGAVEIESGNFHYFDNRGKKPERLDARHIMASGALPPGLPPVEIDGKYWWDGGLVSNTPLQHVLDTQDAPMLVFQVDLFSASDVLPHTMMDVIAREKEIRFSSRTRQVSDALLKLRTERETIRKVLCKLPADMADDADVKALAALAEEFPVNVVQMIYRANAWEGGARDYEFSDRTMNEHWAAGRAAVAATIKNSELIASNIVDGKTAAFDLTPR
jgi:NTE family protein